MDNLEIETGNPPRNGMYVAYVNSEYINTYAEKIFLLNIDGKWGYPGSDQLYRGIVHGWIGPLPGLKL